MLGNDVNGEDGVGRGDADVSLTGREARSKVTGPPFDLRAVWQLTSMSLGIGIFAIPYCFYVLGSIHGAAWVVFMAYLANFAQQRLLDVAAEHHISSYEGLAQHAFGTSGKLIMAILTAVTTFIAMLSYLSAARELLLSAAVAFLLDVDVNAHEQKVKVLSDNKSVVLLALLTASVMPLLISPKMGDNEWISRGGVLCMCCAALFFMGACVVTLATTGRSSTAPALFNGSVADIFQYTSTLAFSFSMIFAVFPLLGERVQDGNVPAAVARIKPAVSASVATCAIIYVLVGLAGSYAFGSDLQPMALANLSLVHPATQAVCFLVGTSSAMLVAIIAFPVLASVQLLGQLVCGADRAPEFAEEGRRGRGCCAPSAGCRAWMTIVLAIVGVAVDAFLPTKTAFALTGSLGLATSAYFMPCIVFLVLDGRGGGGGGGRGAQPPPRCGWRRAVSCVGLLFGAAMLLGSTPVSVYRLLNQTASTTQPIQSVLCHAGF